MSTLGHPQRAPSMGPLFYCGARAVRNCSRNPWFLAPPRAGVVPRARGLAGAFFDPVEKTPTRTIRRNSVGMGVGVPCSFGEKTKEKYRGEVVELIRIASGEPPWPYGRLSPAWARARIFLSAPGATCARMLRVTPIVRARFARSCDCY